MKVEELQEFLKDEKNADTFREIVKAMGFVPGDDYKVIESDRDAERKRKREYQQKLEEMQKKLDDIENRYYTDDEEVKSEKDPVKKLEREILKLKTAYEKETQVRSQLQSRLSEKAKNEQLLKALKGADIDPVHESILISAFAGKAQIEDDETVYIDNKPVGEFFAEWVKSDGAEYKRKAENRGAGAPGFQAKGGMKTSFTREEMKTAEGRKAYLEAAKTGQASIVAQ